MKRSKAPSAGIEARCRASDVARFLLGDEASFRAARAKRISVAIVVSSILSPSLRPCLWPYLWRSLPQSEGVNIVLGCPCNHNSSWTTIINSRWQIMRVLMRVRGRQQKEKTSKKTGSKHQGRMTPPRAYRVCIARAGGAGWIGLGKADTAGMKPFGIGLVWRTQPRSGIAGPFFGKGWSGIFCRAGAGRSARAVAPTESGVGLSLLPGRGHGVAAGDGCPRIGGGRRRVVAAREAQVVAARGAGNVGKGRQSWNRGSAFAAVGMEIRPLPKYFT